MSRLIQLDHSELVHGVQQAMIDQLRRDGKLFADMELGLLFSSSSPDSVQVAGTVRYHGKALFEMAGSRQQLCAIATGLALAKLGAESRRYLPTAQVRFRCVRFTDSEGDTDRFFVDVEFQERQAKTA